MGMQENWSLFLETTKSKSKSHMRAAQYWNTIGDALSLFLIFLGAVITFMALVKAIPPQVVAGFAGLSTLLSAILAFLKPADRRQMQTAASRRFQELMMKMVRCETEPEYEQLWHDLNKCIVDAPFLPKKFAANVDIEWTMTPELLEIIKTKEDVEDDSDHDDITDDITDDTDKKQLLKNGDKSGWNIGNGALNVLGRPNISEDGDNEKLELVVHS